MSIEELLTMNAIRAQCAIVSSVQLPARLRASVLRSERFSIDAISYY
jgi:hypothetical protein